jgi:hypothetical protein
MYFLEENLLKIIISFYIRNVRNGFLLTRERLETDEFTLLNEK